MVQSSHFLGNAGEIIQVKFFYPAFMGSNVVLRSDYIDFLTTRSVKPADMAVKTLGMGQWAAQAPLQHPSI
jgi:hypothetical protein